MPEQNCDAADSIKSLGSTREVYRKQVISVLQNMASRDKLHDTEVRNAVQAAEEFGVDVAFFLIKHQYFKGITSISTVAQVMELVTGMRTQGFAIYGHYDGVVRIFCSALIEGIERSSDKYGSKVR